MVRVVLIAHRHDRRVEADLIASVHILQHRVVLIEVEARQSHHQRRTVLEFSFVSFHLDHQSTCVAPYVVVLVLYSLYIPLPRNSPLVIFVSIHGCCLPSV